MDSVRKIVNCTPEQYLTLLKEGQVEVNGEIKIKEDGTLYNPGELPLLEWYNKVMAEELGRNKVAHSPFIVKSLEQYREDIIADPSNEITADNSAVGFSAILKQGDIVPVHTNPWSFVPGDDNVGLCFINGKEAKTTYTNTSEHEELVRVWYFATSQLPVSLTYVPRYIPHEFVLLSKDGQLDTISDYYYTSATRILIDGSNSVNSFNQVDDIAIKGVTDINCSATSARTFYHEGTTIPSNWKGVAQNKRLTEAVFPNLKTINQNTADYREYVTFRGCDKDGLRLVFPKLIEVKGATDSRIAPFSGVKSVTIPDTVLTLGKNCFSANQNIELNCNRAQSIDPNWCATKPSMSFSMCKEWQASINIAIAAKEWGNERMRNFMENYLADLNDYAPEYSGGAGVVIGAELTIPLAILTTLEENGEDGEVVEENGETRKGCLLIAREKGWIIGGA